MDETAGRVSVARPAGAATPTVGTMTPEEVQDLRRKLEAVGLTRDQVDMLLGQFDAACVQQQLDWLPYRNAKNPAGFLVAAIVDDYEAPIAAPYAASAFLRDVTSGVT